MNKIILSILVGIISTSIQGCSFFSDFVELREEAEQQTANSEQTPVKNEVKKTENKVETGLETVTEVEEEQPIQQVAGLIPATNPDIRVRGSVRGRPDPFSVITLKPQIKAIEEEFDPNKLKQQLTVPKNIDIPKNIKSTPIIESIEENLEPALAQEVIISGLITIGGENKIIVQAPEETSSRYVGVGQYLSNGQILVKHIDPDHFPTPLVILEQYGVEVAKTVGENSAEETETITFLDRS